MFTPPIPGRAESADRNEGLADDVNPPALRHHQPPRRSRQRTPRASAHHRPADINRRASPGGSPSTPRHKAPRIRPICAAADCRDRRARRHTYQAARRACVTAVRRRFVAGWPPRSSLPLFAALFAQVRPVANGGHGRGWGGILRGAHMWRTKRGNPGGGGARAWLAGKPLTARVSSPPARRS